MLVNKFSFPTDEDSPEAERNGWAENEATIEIYANTIENVPRSDSPLPMRVKIVLMFMFGFVFFYFGFALYGIAFSKCPRHVSI